MLNDQRFEIRRGIKNHERHNAILQAAYDTVDRMATVFGDLTFGELLSEPFKIWIPKIIPNIRTAAEYGLIGAPDEVVALFDRIVKAHGDESFRTMAEKMSSDETRLSREIYSPIYKLWFYHGIRLPEFCRYYEENEKVWKAIDAVLEHAPDFNYRTMYTTVRTKDTKAAHLVLKAASDRFIIYLPPSNGLCCSCASGSCHCVSGMSTDWCAQLTSTQCASGSSTCLGNAPIR
jgi:hypothetical protein